jgi:hypothetical protein
MGLFFSKLSFLEQGQANQNNLKRCDMCLEFKNIKHEQLIDTAGGSLTQYIYTCDECFDRFFSISSANNNNSV